MGFGNCTCGRRLVEIDFGGDTGMGKPTKMWQCPVHSGDYDNPENARDAN